MWPFPFLSFLMSKTKRKLQTRAQVLWHSPQFLLLIPLAPASPCPDGNNGSKRFLSLNKIYACLKAQYFKSNPFSQSKAQSCTVVNQITQFNKHSLQSSIAYLNTKIPNLYFFCLIANKMLEKKSYSVKIPIFESSQSMTWRNKVIYSTNPIKFSLFLGFLGNQTESLSVKWTKLSQSSSQQLKNLKSKCNVRKNPVSNSQF